MLGRIRKNKRIIYYVISCYILLFMHLPLQARNDEDALRDQYDSCHNVVKERSKPLIDKLRCARFEIEVGEKLKDDTIILNGYIDTSRILFLLDQYPMALQYAHKALQLSEKCKEMAANAEAKRLCGAIYTDLNDIYNARKYLNEAIGYYEYKKDTASLIYALGTMAISLGENKQFDDCIRTLNKVCRMCESQQDFANLRTSLHNLANVYSLLDQPDKGIRMLDSLTNTIPPSYMQVEDTISYESLMGQLLYQKKDYTRAKEFLLKCVVRARKKYSNDELVSVLTTLSDIAREEKNYQRATGYLAELLVLKDTVTGIDIKRKVSEMEVVYELSQKNTEIDRLNLQNRWNKQRLIFIIIIVVVVLAIIILKFRSDAKLIASKARLLDKELEGKRNELMNIAICFYELRSTISNLNKKLKQIYNRCSDEEVRKGINEICLSIAKSSTVDETKDRINTYIDANYGEFISRLSCRFPDLSDSEKRICAMLLIDYSTKEISDVLNISEKSINNIRSKIRKKMDIPEGFSISQFLQSI